MNENVGMAMFDKYLRENSIVIHSPSEYKKAVFEFNELVEKNPQHGSDEELTLIAIGRSIFLYEKLLYETVFNSNQQYH